VFDEWLALGEAWTSVSPVRFEQVLKPVIRALLESELRARVEDEPANPGLLYCVFDP
jgi:hypothetical protein